VAFPSWGFEWGGPESNDFMRFATKEGSSIVEESFVGDGSLGGVVVDRRGSGSPEELVDVGLASIRRILVTVEVNIGDATSGFVSSCLVSGENSAGATKPGVFG